MSKLNDENQKLIKLCRAVYEIDLDALLIRPAPRMNYALNDVPPSFVVDYESIRLWGILIHAAIQFRKSIKNVPLIAIK